MIDRLPAEAITYIGELCTQDRRKRLRSRAVSRTRRHTRDLNGLARTSQLLYQTLNSLLYHINLDGDVPLNSCVLWAAQKGRLATIKTAHRYGANLDANGTVHKGDLLDTTWSAIPGRLKYFATPLHIAIQNGHKHIVQYLLDNGAGVHVESHNFCNCPAATHTPFPYALHTAIYHSRVPSATEMLIRGSGAYLVAENAPALPILAGSGADELVKVLLENEEPEAQSIALRHAIKTGNEDLFTDILKNLELIYQQLTKWESRLFTLQRTPVHYAARDGKTDVLEILLRHPAIDVAAVDVERKTALHYAAASSAVTAVTLLLEIPETDVFAVDVEDETALHHAARSLDQQSAEAIMRKLVDHGVPIDHLGEHGTALQLASRNQLCQNVMTLLSCGADAVHSDNAPGGWTVLHHCLRCPAESKQVEAVAALVGKGVELDAVVDDDDYYEAHMWDDVDFQSECTPLFLAAVGAKDVECMKLLLAAGAKSDIPVINRCDTSLFRAEGKVEPGEAELFLAAMFRHLWDQSCVSADDVKAAADRVCLLLDHGAGIDKGPGRYSALQYACKYAIGGLFELLALLLNNAGREHISLEHLEEVISTYQSEGSHPNAKETAKTLVKFANRVYPERIDNVNASGAT